MTIKACLRCARGSNLITRSKAGKIVMLFGPFKAGLLGENPIGGAIEVVHQGDRDVDEAVEPHLPRKGTYSLNLSYPYQNQADNLMAYPSCLSTSVKLHSEIDQLGLSPPNTVDGKIGGLVGQAIANWSKITSDKVILNMVRGCPIQFIGEPPKNSLAFQPRFSSQETELITDEIRKMVEKGAIVQVEPEDGQFLGHIFLRPKRDGSMRPIFNLKQLNQWIEYKHFKMEGLFLLKSLLQRGDWMLKLDLKDAYFCVPVKKQHRKFLRFKWNDRLFEFQCLPFGLASAPRDFTKLMKPLTGLLRRIGVRMIIYLDDLLLMNNCPHALLRDGKTTCHLLESMGFVVNKVKSHTTPTQDLEFLGMTISSTKMTMRLSEDKMSKIYSQCQELLHQETVSVRELSAMIGTLSSTSLAVLPAKLYYRELQRLKIVTLHRKKSYATMTRLTTACKDELRWWMNHLKLSNGREIKVPHPDMVIESDACLTGWGATCNGQTIQGHWTAAERKDQINILELRAILLTVKAFLKEKSNIHVHFRADNVTAVAHINKMGGTRSKILTDIAKEIWDFCLQRKILISAEHLPGVMNVEADRLSREGPDSSDWQLDPQIFRHVMDTYGHCKMDLFASRWNTQLPIFVSYKLDPDAVAVDAFQMNWGKDLLYAFPPFCLITNCLAKVQRDRAELVLITPTWHTQPWYGMILNMIIAQPILLPTHPRLLLSPTGTTHPLVQNGSFHLAAWRISADAKRHEAFLESQPTSSQNHGGQVRGWLTTAPGENGLAGVVRKRWIHFRPLWN
jgi:hypothetical protein